MFKTFRFPSAHPNTNANFSSNEKDKCDTAGVSDSDESINDDDNLLKNCILMGKQGKAIESGEFYHTKFKSRIQVNLS